MKSNRNFASRFERYSFTFISIFLEISETVSIRCFGFWIAADRGEIALRLRQSATIKKNEIDSFFNFQENLSEGKWIPSKSGVEATVWLDASERFFRPWQMAYIFSAVF
jgi:hypothetical protein